jgi:prepilin-type processing-associated H-X9-DG protein
MSSTAFSFAAVRPASGRRAMSMPEMLMVIGMIALLLALLFPSLSAARERVRRAMCAHNLRQWGLALTAYRNDNRDYLPTEGTYLNMHKPYTWFNELPRYLGLPPYVEAERIGKLIKEFPELSVWICPAKNRTSAFKSRSGNNQFHYAMNQVLDGLGRPPHGSTDTPGFPDQGDAPLASHVFKRPASTVFLFEIAWNSPAGSPRDVATKYQRDFDNCRVGEFHGDYANLLFLDGAVDDCRTDDLVARRDFRRGKIRWRHPRLYWGYTPPRP